MNRILGSPITAAHPLCVGCADVVDDHAYRLCDRCYARVTDPDDGEGLPIPAMARVVYVPVAAPTVWQRLRRWWRT